MNMKKILLSAIIVVIGGIFMMASVAEVNAKSETSIYLGLNPFMTMSPNFGYAINGYFGNNNVNDFANREAARIWNILKYKSANPSSGYDNVDDIYCLREGEGFLNASGESDDTIIKEYNESYNMKTDKTDINNKIYNWSKTIDGVNQYNAILAVLDLFYVKGNSADTYRQNLIENAIGKEQYESYDDNAKITDSDIKAVQQAALWYFTNYGENNKGLYDQTGSTTWLNYTEDGNTYSSLSDYERHNGDIGLQRQEQVNLLYNYFIRTAKANANKYNNSTGNNATVPAKVNTVKLEYSNDGNNYIVGPINITKQESSSILDSINLELKNGNNSINNFTLLKNDKTNANTNDVKDLLGQDFYIAIPKSSVTISNLKISFTINYSTTNLKLWTHSTNKSATQPVVIPQKESESSTTTLATEGIFDLALRKYITKVKGVELTGNNSRVPNIDESTLQSGTTAIYKHRKDPVVIKTGNIVTYKMTIYNEGEKAGRATKVVDQLPTGLKFKQVVSGNFEEDTQNPYNETNNILYLSRKTDNTDNLPAYTSGDPASETIEIECEVTAIPDYENTIILTNVAWISEEIDGEGNVTINNQVGADRDSEPGSKPDVNKGNMSDYKGKDNKEDLTDSDYYYKGQQDDDDFEKLILMPESFDLKLIKRITAVNNQNVSERIESVDVSKLNTIGKDGKLVTTGDYQLNKNPVGVKKGDIVTYTFRIYNEGTIDGYASEITEDIPEGLEFIWSEKEGDELKEDTTLTDEEKEAIEFNQKYLWGNFKYNDKKDKIIEISTDYLSKENETTLGGNLIKAFGENDGTKTEKDISYKEVSVKLKVVSEDKAGNTIRNEACISEDTDKDENPIDDRDSDTEDWVKYEDDEDYDNIILQSFDLALRKFIIAVSDDTTIDKEEYLKNADGSYTRAPVVDTSKLNTEDEDGKLITTAIYNHTKEPILVNKNDNIIYMLRVYNEGDADGYASEIKDHLPPQLEYVDSDYNKKYGWTVSEDGRTVTTRYLENSKISKPSENSDGKLVLAYKEVPIMCKVKDTVKTSEKITNIADITEYLDENKKPVTDRDSQPDNVELPEDAKLPSYKDDEDGEYISGQQDDDDFEKVIVKEFDLALRKWVTQAILIENGQQTVTNTGHDAWDDPEQIVKVELHRKKLDQVTVKFRYSIRVYNQGDVEGYAKEITDYIPEGLKFVAEDNPGWTDEGNNVISTRLLENTLLKPGEYADIEVLLTWVNDENNMGLKVNTAEISEDYNKYNLPDKDSTPDNQKQGEDDIDDAPVMLSITTGQIRIYFTIGFVILIIVAGGVVLIKKYVL